MNMQQEAGKVLLEVKGLKTHLFTRRGVVRAVDGVDFELHQGETLGVVGESGSGKSMTALSLLKLAPQPAGRIVAGEILFNGEDLVNRSNEEMRDIRGRLISMILQDPQSSLNPAFTIGNQIMETLRIHRKGKTGDRKTLLGRAIESLRMVNIAAPDRRVHDYPHQMSGGMKQRVVGAIAISCTPQIIIADEPTTSLDLTIQAQYLRLLQDIQKQLGSSIIFITHDFGIVAKMCDRVVVMYAGRIVERGSVRAIFREPSHPYTQALIHSVPKIEARTERLYSIPGQPPTLDDESPGCRFRARCAHAVPRCALEYPPRFSGRSGMENHQANCWRLEDPTWKPTLY